MFLDIDEFWVPEDFTAHVGQLVSMVSDGERRPICHLWHCELGQGEAFSFLNISTGYVLSSHLKTLFPIQDTEIKHVRIHHPIFGRNVIPYDTDGWPVIFSKDHPELACQSVIKPKRAYVVHRMYRSEDEYLALLLRGRPSQKQQLKTNRPGHLSHENVSARYGFSWPKQSFGAYDKTKRQFIEALDIEELVEQDKFAILHRASQAVGLLKQMLGNADRDEAIRLLKGTRYRSLANDVLPTSPPVHEAEVND
ncbi:hypothetical protein [Salinicola peritrichatus]|uniref:hypothetical protein n=1 Tax=Salinicola peritrichatus TaxID=1267424 RepID=UPI000DA1EC64|nr:hypothetical protein [Salinicola peritrichatus]